MQTAQPTGPAQIDYYSSSQYEAPEGPYSVVTAADGSTWYQVASGEGSAAFYDVPEFSGSALEESQVRGDLPRRGRGHQPSDCGAGRLGSHRRKRHRSLVQQRLL